MSKYRLRYEEYSPIFLAEIFRRNLLDKSFLKLEGVKGFLKSALDYFTDKRNIGKIPLEDHIELIKVSNDFKVRSEAYVHELLSYFNGDLTYFTRELYMLAGNMGVVLSKKEMDKLIEYNFFTGFSSGFSKSFNMFLLNENEIPNPNDHLKNIIASTWFLILEYNELSAKEKVSVYSLHYEYLKSSYPEETKDWVPNQIDKADFCRNFETFNIRNLVWLR